MNATKDTRTLKAGPDKTKKSSREIEAVISKLRKKGISAISNMNAPEQVQAATWAQDVFERYGSALEKFPGKVKDLSKLPCSKHDVKIAIKILLPIWCARESENMVDMLKDRYIRLGAFQEITEEDKDTLVREANDIDQKPDATDISTSPIDHKYMDIILTEQKVLLDEINSFINDLQIPKSDT